MPPVINGRPSKHAHPWLVQLFEDLDHFSKISDEFKDVSESIGGNYVLLFDTKHEYETSVFTSIDVKIIRRQFLTVQIPPPTTRTSSDEAKRNNTEERQQDESKTYECQVKV